MRKFSFTNELAMVFFFFKDLDKDSTISFEKVCIYCFYIMIELSCKIRRFMSFYGSYFSYLLGWYIIQTQICFFKCITRVIALR